MLHIPSSWSLGIWSFLNDFLRQTLMEGKTLSTGHSLHLFIHALLLFPTSWQFFQYPDPSLLRNPSLCWIAYSLSPNPPSSIHVDMFLYHSIYSLLSDTHLILSVNQKKKKSEQAGSTNKEYFSQGKDKKHDYVHCSGLVLFVPGS